MRHLMAGYLAQKGAQAGALAAAAFAAATKADDPDDAARRAKRIADELDIDWSDLPPQVYDVMDDLVKGAAMEGLTQIGVTVSTATTLANDRAAAWAAERAAEMVGMRWVDGALVTNPSARWAITEGTRDMVASYVEQAITDGWGNDQLAAAIAQDGDFSDARAMTIARTETAMADVQGNVAAYETARELGIVIKKQWLTAGDDLVSEDCKANGEQDPIDLDATFKSGVDAPPDHPNCRCDLLPVTYRNTDSEEE